METPETSNEEPVAGRNQATVNDNGVNLRSEASTAGDVVTTLSQGEVVTVLGDSQEADGFVWWPVRLDDGTKGGWSTTISTSPSRQQAKSSRT